MAIDDVFEDAHNNFIADIKVDFSNDKENNVEETQMDLIMKKDKAFDWTEDDEINMKKFVEK